MVVPLFRTSPFPAVVSPRGYDKSNRLESSGTEIPPAMNLDVGSDTGPPGRGAAASEGGRPDTTLVAVDGRTPYQIFRNCSTAPAGSHGEARRFSFDVGPYDAEDGDEDRSGGEDDVEDDEDEKEEEGDDKENRNPRAKSNGPGDPAGFLSSNSAEIRRNARRILMQQPRNKRRQSTRKRLSLPLLPIHSQNDRCDEQPFRDIKGELEEELRDMKTAAKNVKGELEEELREMKTAAKNMANRAGKVGGEALDALSMGARSVFGQLWD